MKDSTKVEVPLLVGLFFVIFGVSSWAFSLTFGVTSWALSSSQELSNEFAVVIEAAIAILLAGVFFHIQDSNNRRRKQFWLNVAYEQLEGIRSVHSSFRDAYAQFLETDDGEITCQPVGLQPDDDVGMLVVVYRPKLERAIDQVAELLHPSLFSDISGNGFSMYSELVTHAYSTAVDRNEAALLIATFDARIKVLKVL